MRKTLRISLHIRTLPQHCDEIVRCSNILKHGTLANLVFMAIEDSIWRAG